MSISEYPGVKPTERRVTPVERLFTRSPFATVVVVARIRGRVSESMLRHAVQAVQQRHPNLRVRIREDVPGEPWFTSQGAAEIAVEIVPRESRDHWIALVQQAAQIPFDFHVRPALRVILAQSPDTCELVILCHHIICDGLSLAYLARDLMLHLGEPEREVEILPDPAPIDTDTIPQDVSLNPVLRFMVRRINKRWAGERVLFDQQDYEALSAAYWARYEHKLLPVELSRAQTTALVERCRKEEVTVNSALAAAFVGAQVLVQGERPHHSDVRIAASLRDYLQRPVGEAMGFYAGLVSAKYTYDTGVGFWKNARRLHRQVGPLLSNKTLFGELLMWCHLDPTIMEAINFKKLGPLVPEHSPRHEKLTAFGQRDDTVQSILKRDKMESLNRLIMGTAVTNLTRMDFPARYGALELERLIIKPGGFFPLVNANLLVGAVTCSGRLSLALEYVEENIDVSSMETIRNEAIGCLLSA